MYRYSEQFDPPAPTISIDISSPAQLTPVAVLALIDSGSDITVIPRPVAQTLSLQPVYMAYSIGVSGTPAQTTVYSALVSVEKEEHELTEVLIWEEDYVLLGRDIINQWSVFLNGPEQVLTISGPED